MNKQRSNYVYKLVGQVEKKEKISGKEQYEGTYFFVYLQREKEQEQKEQTNQSPPEKSSEEIEKELQKDALKKGRIWELPSNSWADRIVKGKSSSLLGEYQKYANLFPDGDRNEKFKFSRSASYTIHFPPSLQEYYEKGKGLDLDCNLLKNEEELILSKTIENWIERVKVNPIRGKKDKNKKDNSALFYGAPGTGKTATMKNLCYRADKYPLVEIKGSNLTPTEADQRSEILPLQKFAYTISELEWSLVNDYGFEREENGEVRYILFVDEANQISNNSLIFQPSELKFLKDCLEGINQEERSNNLWVFATNHLHQIEEATYRKGRLSNPLDFSWNWTIFKKYAKEHGIFGEIPLRWSDDNVLKPKDNEQLNKFNDDIFVRDFLGYDADEPNKPHFWDLFIANNPDAKYTPKQQEQENNNNTDLFPKEIEIELGEFLKFFWYVREKYLMDYDGKYNKVSELTVETALEALVRTVDDKLKKIIGELEQSREDGKEQIMGGINDIIKSLANR